MTTTKHQDTERLSGGSVALWASAFVIFALIIVQAGRLDTGNAAYAGNVTSIGDLTILTAEGGDNDDVLAILDRRDERLFMYGVRNRNQVELFQIYELGGAQGMFAQARQAAGP